MVTSGIRLGAPAGTTRGFGIAEFRDVGRMIAEVLDGLAKNGEAGNAATEAKVKDEAIALCQGPDLQPAGACGEIMRLRGKSPTVPSADFIRLNDKGQIEGLF